MKEFSVKLPQNSYSKMRPVVVSLDFFLHIYRTNTLLQAFVTRVLLTFESWNR